MHNDDVMSQRSHASGKKAAPKPPLSAKYHNSAHKLSKNRPPIYVSPSKNGSKASINENSETHSVLEKRSLHSHYSQSDIMSQASSVRSNMSYSSYSSRHLKSAHKQRKAIEPHDYYNQSHDQLMPIQERLTSPSKNKKIKSINKQKYILASQSSVFHDSGSKKSTKQKTIKKIDNALHDKRFDYVNRPDKHKTTIDVLNHLKQTSDKAKVLARKRLLLSKCKSLN